jgi:hypothetical protein
MLEDMYYAGRSGCQICQLRVLGILQAMSWNSAPPIVRIEMDTYSGTTVMHVVSEKYRNDLWLQSVAYDLNLFSIKIFTPFRTKPCFHPFVGVRQDIAWIVQDSHLSVIIEWLRHCKDEHPACASTETPPPSRVVDVGTDALTHVSLYLSWGESTPYCRNNKYR